MICVSAFPEILLTPTHTHTHLAAGDACGGREGGAGVNGKGQRPISRRSNFHFRKWYVGRVDKKVDVQRTEKGVEVS